ncbi:MAG TPA: hypothetical protein VLX92_04555 [Kofleriaceae bacterium]|nr:hypothetical protein [Kofleriaceae bacterium]
MLISRLAVLAAVVAAAPAARAGNSPAVAAALAKLPTIALDDGGLNPRTVDVAVPGVFTTREVDRYCGDHGFSKLVPLARLKMTKPSTWFIATETPAGEFVELYVLTDDGHCGDPRRARFEAGEHTLWAVVPFRGGMPARLTLELVDESAEPRFGDAPKQPVASLAAPMVIDGAVRAPDKTLLDHACHSIARAPDFYLTSATPLQHARLALVDPKGNQTINYYGPMERWKQGMITQCGRSGENSREIDILEGTYAVWIGAAAPEAVGQPYHVVVTDGDTKIDPDAPIVEIPRDLALPDRALSKWYPGFAGAQPHKRSEWTALFTKAPDQMFVYPRVAIADAKLPAGEPLLVAWASDERTAVIRYDGSETQVDTRLITTDRPATVVLPTRPDVPSVGDSIQTATDLSGPEDKATIDAYWAKNKKYRDCVDAYRSANDPTYGSGDHVYAVSGGKVINVGDKYATAADRRCGGAALDAAQDAMMKKLATTRAARLKADLVLIRKRFGL